MPFLSSQPTVRRVRTELGYSITCHASMYTGLRPDRHGLWFVWQRRPSTSPFRWLRPLRFLDHVDNLPMHVLATKITRRFTRTSSWFGIPYPIHARWRDLPDLDVSERKLWPEEGYLDTAPTIFDKMRRAGVRFEIVGMERRPPRGIATWRTWRPPPEPAPFTYLFAGDIDHESHAFGQRSAQVGAILREVDGLIEANFRALAESAGDPALVVWSDHGHHDVTPLNPLTYLPEHGVDLQRYEHVIDTNFIRFWIPGSERRRLTAGLDAVGIGHVLTEEELQRHRVKMSDDRYGNLIFYVERPWALTHTIWGFGRRLASGHGYLPDHSQSDAVLVSNVPAQDRPIHLVDLGPSILTLLGIPPEDALDGASVWSSLGP